jgi:hypothetical protein
MKPRTQDPADASPPSRRWAATRRCLIALGFIACFIAIGIGAASTARHCPTLPFFEAFDVIPILIVVVFELWPAFVALRGGIRRRDRRAIRRLHRQLEALPETRHPLGA